MWEEVKGTFTIGRVIMKRVVASSQEQCVAKNSMQETKNGVRGEEEPRVGGSAVAWEKEISVAFIICVFSGV